jgi:isopenicillin N synthase-like dioxygenase
MSAVPLIDLSGWYSGDQTQRSEIAVAVDEALTNSGFLLITGTRIPSELPQMLRAAVKEFFVQPDEIKQAYECGVGGRGWVPLGAEANAYSEGIDSPPDLKETFTFGNDHLPPNPDDPANAGWYEPNRWPAELPKLRVAGEAFVAAANALVNDLLEVCAVALRLPVDYFTSRCAHPPYSVNLNRYPAQQSMAAVAEGAYRIGPHTDFGTLTILDRQQGRGGLQVRTPSGEWIDAPFEPGSFTVNTGDLLARWTGDRWRSTPHRVLPPDPSAPAEELISLIFFHEADPGSVISTLPDDVAGRKRYPDVTAGEFLRMRLESITV